jgi:hypothetical protein
VVANASVEPSGFHAGPWSRAGSMVSRANPVPSALIEQTSSFPISAVADPELHGRS